MKNNSKLCSNLTIICIVCAIICVAVLTTNLDGQDEFKSFIGFLFGGCLGSYIISRHYFYKSVKKEIAEAVEKTKKDVEDSLNKQFNQYHKFLNKVNDKSTESLLRKYKTSLVHQLENDMAVIWNVRPGATVGVDVSLLDPTAMDNADDKYYKMLDSIYKRSEDLFNSILNGKSN